MKYRKSVFLMFVLFSLESCAQPGRLHGVNLYADQVSIEVPVDWQIKEKYRRYSDPQIKYDVKISNERTKSVFTAHVYDSSYMYNAPINNRLIENYKNAQLKTKGKSLDWLDQKVIRINDKDVGVLKYTFNPVRGKLCYGAQFFFRSSANYFYEIEVYSLGQSVTEFKKVVDKMINSLSLMP